jgi:hypothetical protein
MPARPAQTPENYLPTDDELLELISHHANISLRELCGRLWPNLRWYGLRVGDDSAVDRVRPFGKTAAAWVLEQMARLAAAGHVRFVRRPDEVDATAGIAFEPTRLVLYHDPPVLPDRDRRFGPQLPGEPRRRRREGAAPDDDDDDDDKDRG